MGKGLKRAPDPTDGRVVATRDLACPVCDADVPLTGDERLGEEVYCPFCRAPLTIKQRPGNDDEMELEDDL